MGDARRRWPHSLDFQPRDAESFEECWVPT